jgi:hypothetical protein
VALGRNAVSIYQDLVDRMGFAHRYNSVKRFVRTLRKREPERFDILDGLPGEEAQVDFGLGAPTLYRAGRYRRPGPVRDDAEALRQSFPQGGVESGPGEPGASTRRGLSGPSSWGAVGANKAEMSCASVEAARSTRSAVASPGSNDVRGLL